MKPIRCFFSLFLMIVSFSAFADKVVITGEPVVLEQKQGLYSLPSDYTGTTSYYYVTVSDTKKVCYLEKQANLTSLTPELVNVAVNGRVVPWYCYPFDETYFEVGP